MFDYYFCYDTPYPGLCLTAIKFVVFVIVTYIIYKLVSPRIKAR
ncbi:unnamed protein product [marine sediment metagenome]|uniref:Uncharacterized protein n=1 Tax=marine sediment metagenome TaxID=412755 RepID=X0WUR4_9ZZZZ